MELLFGNYPNSFLVYVWVRKTLTLIIKVFLVGLSSVLMFVLIWFWFEMKFSSENRAKMLIFVSTRHLFA